jgi:hypothetical protein
MTIRTLGLYVLLFFYSSLFCQRTFVFNTSGNECYFPYVLYAANNTYNAMKRPVIAVLGEEGQSAMQNFETDSLKSQPFFSQYLFIYLPNNGGAIDKRLNCIDALSSLVTNNFSAGKKNVFCFIRDGSIKETDQGFIALQSYFKSVKLQTRRSVSAVEQVAQLMIEFREDINGYDKTATLTEADGTYYEEATTEHTASELPIDQKIYFGEPKAKNFTFTGLVRDRISGEALPFASVQLRGKSVGTISNADGLFTLVKVPTDTTTLLITYVGYQKRELYLTPATPKSNFVIELNPANTLKAVDILTAREDVVLSSKTDVSVIKMTPKKLEQLPNVGERDIMRSFQLMPGVSAANESSSGLYVRGGTPDQNLVLFDGFTIYHVDHLYGFFSAFNSNALKDVQLYKGGFESRFGGRLSSVTEITGKDGNQKRVNAGIDVSLLSLNAYVEVPLGDKFTSIVAVRRSYKGFLYNRISDKFGKSSTLSSAPTGRGPQQTSTTASSYFYDVNGKFTYRLSSRDLLSLSIFNGNDKLDNSSSNSNSNFGATNSNFSMSTTDLTNYGNTGISLKYGRKWNSRLYGTTIASYSNYYSDRDRSQQRSITNAAGETSTTKNGILETNNLKDFSLKSDYSLDVFKSTQLQFGVFATMFDIKYTYAQNDTTTILNKSNQGLLSGGYLQSKSSFFGGKLNVLPGIRASYYEQTAKWYYEPRLSASLALTRRLTVKAATGQYYQFANRITREDILSGSKEFWILSDGKSVPVSSALHYIAGLSYETNSLLFSVEGYYKKLKDITEYSLRFNPSPRGVTYAENFFTGYGFSRGLEFMIQKKTGKFNGWVSYTLGQARNHFDVYSDGYFPANQDVTHEFKVVGLYKYKRWDFSATWIFATGRPYTAPSGAYSVELLDGTTQDFFTVTTKNGLRLPNYHRADVSANYKLLLGQKGDKKRRDIGYIGFSIFNLYNRTNVWYKQFSIDEGVITETNVNYLGFTPNITLSLKIQ